MYVFTKNAIINYHRYSFCGVNMVPQRQLENISDPLKSVLKTVLWNDFFQALFCRITANF